MSNATTSSWHKANQRYLLAALALVRAALERHAARSGGGSEPPEQDSALQQQLAAAARDMPAPPALEQLCSLFGLSRFERDVLLLCAGMELDSAFASLCAAAQGEAGRPCPTFSLALAALREPHWSALTPAAPLRRWRLLEVAGGNTLTLSPLRIDERVLHYLVGVQHLDERLAGLIEPVRAAGEALVPSHRGLAERLAMTWSQASGEAPLPVVQLCGTEPAGKQAIAAAACAALGLNLNRLAGNVIPLAAAGTWIH